MNMKRECMCHGTSGSCSSETCWNAMPNLHTIADKLRAKMKNTKRVWGTRTSSRPRRQKLKLINGNRNPRLDDLVYLEKSPNFCNRNMRKGILGTTGRKCHLGPGSKKSGHCDDLCCGQSYWTRDYNRTEKCNCKFMWCCQVDCEECTVRVREHTCR